MKNVKTDNWPHYKFLSLKTASRLATNMSVLKAYLRGQSLSQSEEEHTCAGTDSLSPLDMLWYLFMLICGLPKAYAISQR